MPDKYVNPTQLEWLQWHDKLIKWMKADLLAQGPGNQIPWIRGVKHLSDDIIQNPNDPRPRVALIQQMYMQKAKKDDWYHPLFMYAAALTYGAANCQEYAAVVYVYLRQNLKKNQHIVSVVNEEQHHCFTLISPVSIKKKPDPANCYVVDPWPTKAQAVLLEDHFCWPKEGWSRLSVLRDKPGLEGKEKDKAKALVQKAEAWARDQVGGRDPEKVKANAIANVLEYERKLKINSPSHKYPVASFYVEYCAKDKHIINYVLSPRFLTEKERMKDRDRRVEHSVP